MNDSYWLRSGFYTLSEKGASLLFGFGGAILLFRLLPKETFGVWVVFLSITSIVEVARVGLLQNALVKYLSTAADTGEAGRIITASLILNLLLTILLAGLMYGLSAAAGNWFDAPELAGLLRIYCITTFALIPFFQCNYVQQANLDFKGIFWGSFVKSGVVFAYILFLFLSKAAVPLAMLAVAQIVAALLASGVSWYFARQYIVFSRRLDRAWMGTLFRYGKYVFGTNLSTQLYKNVDKLLLGALPGGGKVAVALYHAAIQVTNLTDVPTASMATMLFPQSARRMNEGPEALKQLYEKAVGAILAIMLPCIAGVLLFAEFIIHLVAGPQYLEAANLLRITILFGLFLPYAVQFGTVLDSIGKPGVNFLYTIGSLALTAGLNAMFIPLYGAYGAAAGTLAAYAATFVFMQIFLYKKLKVNPLAPFCYAVYFYKKFIAFGSKNIRARMMVNS